MKKMILILLLMTGFASMAQSQLTIMGTVMDNTPIGQPIPNQEITIDVYAGGALFVSNVVYSDSVGYYADFIQLNNNQGEVIISTQDCDSTILSYSQTFFGDSLFVYHDFVICGNFPPGCVADFRYEIQEPLTVSFLNLSQGGESYFWDFGDGHHSNEENPEHTYQDEGYYNICLTLMSNDSSCYSKYCQTVTLTDDTLRCQANFTYFPVGDSNNPIHGSLTVQFLDMSLGNPSLWFWQFGDGTGASDPNPIHTFGGPGIYQVCLTIQSADSSCTSTFCQDVVVQNDSASCVAQFVHHPADSAQGDLSLQFIDLSYGNPTHWLWDFGDGHSSTEQNPMHTYASEGDYYVCLTINGPDCQSVWCENVWVGAGSDCYNYFSYQVLDNTVVFSGFHSANIPASYVWEFGDGTSAMGQEVTHSYSGPGMYYVSLTTFDDNLCRAFSSQLVVVGDTIAYNQVYGQVFEGDFPLEQGVVMIFSIDTSLNYNPFIDVTLIDSSGVYVFPYVPSGEFVIYALNTTYNQYLPTYYGDVINWEDAEVVVLGQPNNPYDIHLVSAVTTSIGGNGVINGQISDEVVRGSGFLDKINMLLYNESKESLGFANVTSDGDFNMDNLAYGVYYLYPELTGVSAEFIRVELTSEQPTAQVNMTFSGGSITGIENQNELVFAGEIYPNPVTYILKINIEALEMSDVGLKIIGTDGRVYHASNINLNGTTETIQINVSDLPKGMFILQITDHNQVFLNRKFIR
ncbi:MAG: hypothetical protein CVT99_02760 [Bacteroidetes bacterium HGW-Bacteroidetes-16]|jgi:PKD repeat protein|nr:MAG: hypothetical protein CVT99_02760 [Bacteroidetes bacterium HGW-Bacteroidetes-16]